MVSFYRQENLFLQTRESVFFRQENIRTRGRVQAVCKYENMRFEHFKKVCVTYNIFIYHRNVWHLMQVFNMIYKIFIICTRLHIFTSCFAQLAEFFILFDSCKSSSRHCSNAQRPGCILNISLDCCTILRIDSLGVLVAHEFVSTR